MILLLLVKEKKKGERERLFSQRHYMQLADASPTWAWESETPKLTSAKKENKH